MLKCSKGVISYHCGIGQKEKTYNRNIIHKRTLYSKINVKIQSFSSIKKHKISIISNNKTNFRQRINTFSMSKNMKYSTPLFTVKELLDRVGDDPKCYLTGKSIDINNVNAWCLDHKIPRSRGGNNTLDNAGICDSKVNLAKTDMLIDEFLEVCKSVLEYNGYKVIKDSSLPDWANPQN